MIFHAFQTGFSMVYKVVNNVYSFFLSSPSAPAKLSTAIAKKTFSRMSERTLVKAPIWPGKWTPLHSQATYSINVKRLVVSKFNGDLVAKHNMQFCLSKYIKLLYSCLYTVGSVLKDTVTTDEENDKIQTHNHTRKHRASIRRNSIIHHHVPVLTCQNLRTNIRLDKTNGYIYLSILYYYIYKKYMIQPKFSSVKYLFKILCIVNYFNIYLILSNEHY